MRSLIKEIRKQRNKVEVLYELYKDEISSLNDIMRHIEIHISMKLMSVFDEVIPVNIYENRTTCQIWFEFDVLGLDLNENQIAMIEEITKTTMNEEHMFYFNKNEYCNYI